jgi:hypothetical protein
MAQSSSWSSLRNREAGRRNRNSMMRRSRGKLGLLSLPLDAAVTSATSENFFLATSSQGRSHAHKKGTLFSLSDELLAGCPGVLHSKWQLIQRLSHWSR